MRKILLAATVVVCALGGAKGASAQVLDTVNVQDDVYGNFMGTISAGQTGSAAELNWSSAISGLQFDLFFVNSSGTVQDVLTNDPSEQGFVPGDYLDFFGAASGNLFVGESCASASASVAVTVECVTVTPGSALDLTSFFDAHGNGICCGASDISVTIGDSLPEVPEPSSLLLLGLPLAALGLVRRARPIALQAGN